jgi:hypothetical protein
MRIKIIKLLLIGFFLLGLTQVFLGCLLAFSGLSAVIPDETPKPPQNLRPELTALVIVERQRYRTPEGVHITATHYNNGMTCYRSDYGSVWVSCDGGLSRSEKSERTKRHTDRMKQSINSIEKE